MYHRELISTIQSQLNRKEVVLLCGARQTGKSTMLDILSANHPDMLVLNCEQTDVADTLRSKNISRIKALFDDNKIIAFDEAQTITEIGQVLKLLYDQKQLGIKMLATGSSSFDLSNKTGEPLTGRNILYKLFPLSIKEINSKRSWQYILEHLGELLIYGTYPGIIDLPVKEKRQSLLALSGDYLFKDIFKFEQLRNPELLRKLLKALALQLGSLVSSYELSNLLGVAKQTVKRYLDLLEKSFIIYSLPSFSSNLRNELKKSKKYYFYDPGIRNAVINNFLDIDNRNDMGALWENFCVNELIKEDQYNLKYSNFYFWRTYDGAVIDLISEMDGKFRAFEFKWGKTKKPRIPASFSNKYQVETLELITPEQLYLFK